MVAVTCVDRSFTSVKIPTVSNGWTIGEGSSSDLFLHQKYTHRKETVQLAAAEVVTAHTNWFSILVIYSAFFMSFWERKAFKLQWRRYKEIVVCAVINVILKINICMHFLWKWPTSSLCPSWQDRALVAPKRTLFIKKKCHLKTHPPPKMIA